ncbi:MAG: hypothetical protein ACKVQK_21995, partial [Burkholderiales bacterium]
PIRLRDWIKKLIEIETDMRTLVLESFGYKAGVPLDADLVFDARCLPNPFYEPTLRALTGQDDAVARFLDAEPSAIALYDEIAGFLERWLPLYSRDNRSYFTVAIGCTGGRHRSVYLAEKLAARIRVAIAKSARDSDKTSVGASPFDAHLNVLVRHREIAGT